MTGRSRASAKKAGSSFERLIADGLRAALNDDRIERAPRWGSKDKGDIVNVQVNRLNPVAILVAAPADGKPLAIECKDVRRLSLGLATEEAKVEAQHAGAVCGVVVHKRYGSQDPLAQWVTMTVGDLVALIAGGLPETSTREM